MKQKQRCHWCGDEPLNIQYHDEEWGVPLYEDNKLFELLILEGMQAGLSWITILKKRENFRQAFANFDPKKIATFSDKKVEQLMQNEGIIRNRLKINAVITNATAYLELTAHSSLSDYLWQFTDDRLMNPARKTFQEIPVNTKESDNMSKALKKLGFKFVGTTICYAYMQAIGMVNDHTVDCFRYAQLAKKSQN